MIFDEPINVSDATFEKAVLRAKLPVLVDFWSPSCAPCKTMTPILKTLAKEFNGKVLITKVNTQDYPQLAQSHQILGVPTMVFFSEGKELSRESGAIPEAQLRQIIKQVFRL